MVLFLLMIFIFFMLRYLAYYVAAKILTKDWKLRLKESVYIILASMFCTLVRMFPNIDTIVRLGGGPVGVHPFRTFSIISSSLLGIFLLFIYAYKVKSYSLKKAVIYTVFVDLIVYLPFLLVEFVFTSFLNLHSVWPRDQGLLAISQHLALFVLSALFAFILTKTLEKLRNAINANERLLTALAVGSAISRIVVFASLASTFVDGAILEYWAIIIVLGFIAVSLASFFLYSKILTARLALKQKETEHENLQFYLSEIEQQQTVIRKFKHDQQNLFTALDIYVQDKDWNGLMQFYPKLRDASDIITKNEFELEGLSKIKVREVKNILIAKLVTAQSLEFNTKFEMGEEIDHIPADPVTMVRMLGIILDNAIEELQFLGGGVLNIACFRIEDSVNFVVQNTCRVDIPPLRQLRESGFSTKGKNRGLGLSNLYELIDSLPTATLMTDVEDGYFTQTLTIGGIE